MTWVVAEARSSPGICGLSPDFTLSAVLTPRCCGPPGSVCNANAGGGEGGEGFGRGNMLKGKGKGGKGEGVEGKGGVGRRKVTRRYRRYRRGIGDQIQGVAGCGFRV